MEKLPMCRICLVVNAPLYVVDNKNLQDIYEKLTDVPFVTEDKKPMLACSFCFTKLNQSVQLQRKCLLAEQLFNQMLQKDFELDTPLMYPGQLEYSGGLTRSPMEHMSIADEWQVEVIHTDEDGADQDNSTNRQYTKWTLNNSSSIEYSPSDDDYIRKELKEELQVPGNHHFIEFNKEHENNGASGAKKPTLDIGKGNIGNMTVKQEKNELSGSKIIRTTQNLTAHPDTKCKEPAKKCNLKYLGSEKPYKCHVCQKVFTQEAYLKRHSLIHSVEKPHQCTVCQRGFRLKYLLDIHFRVHTGEKPYNCTFCQKCFSQSSHLKHHVRTHTGEKPYKCNVCQYSYRTKVYLDNHIRTHTGEKPYMCNICQCRFISLPMLKTHFALHSCDNLYKCDICQRGFNIKSNLKKHIRIHTGEKPYKCSICQLSFNQKHALNIHVRNKHTGEKPYTCDVCLRSFSAMNVLKNHLLIHSAEKPYTCDVCQRSFNRKSNLENHVLIHSNEKQYQCEICAKFFRQRSTLNSHLWVHKKGMQ